jgi:hypothetical protein
MRRSPGVPNCICRTGGRRWGLWVGSCGLLNALDGEVPGSPWWRAVNERLLRDTAEARAHVLGLIQPRLGALYSWSAVELSIPELSTMVQDGVPAYSWDITDVEPWKPATGRLASRMRPSRA